MQEVYAVTPTTMTGVAHKELLLCKAAVQGSAAADVAARVGGLMRLE